MPDLAIDRALAAVRLEKDATEQIVRDAEKYEWPHLKEHRAHLSDLRAALAILEAARAWAPEIGNVPPETTGHVFDEVAITPIELALWRAIRGEAP